MTVSLQSMLPTAALVRELPPEELAGVLLTHLNSLPANDLRQLNRYNFFVVSNQDIGPFREYPPSEREGVAAAFIEAWMWLEHEGLIVPKGDIGGNAYRLSRRAERMTTQADVAAYRHANALPRDQLHPRIAQKVWALFLRGDYDVAVTQAFKEVEVAVRDVGGFAVDDYGADLLGRAFNAERGPLRDTAVPLPERKAMASLFVGAYGVFRNPMSHRHVPLTDPREAAEIIAIASHLLRIVDTRRK